MTTDFLLVSPPSQNSLSLRQGVFLLCVLLSLVCIPIVQAGHGFATSFGNIEWLPEPGESPDSTWYQADAWQEEGQLWLAETPAQKVTLYLTFAREKLAEVEAMIKAENATAAQTATTYYTDYITRGRQLIDDSSDESQETLAEEMATALLEHQFILSVIYEELPKATRGVVPSILEAAQTHYEEVSQVLPRKKKGALFFKEEEVRWSVQMALRADEEEAENQGSGKP